MHDQHDDPLARELARLSQYSGPATNLWQEAIDKHRRDQQQQVWVWVRRPAPALAAACLALMVAAISLRPVGPVSPAVASRFRSETSAAASKGLATDNLLSDFDGNRLPRDITQNSKGFQNYNVRYNDLQNERYAPAPQGNAPARDAETTGILTGNADPASRRIESGSNLASRGGVNAPGYGAGGGGGGGGGAGNKSEHATGSDQAAGAPRPSAGMAPLQPAVAGNPGAPAGTGGGPAPDDKLAAKSETAEKLVTASGSKAADYAKDVKADPLDQTTTVRLAVSDVNRFYYNQVPELVDAKNGESITAKAVEGADPKDASGGANLTLRVSEERLPAVVEELRKIGSVQEVKTQLVPREERLKQIDALVAQSEDALKKDASPAKYKIAPSVGAPASVAPGSSPAAPPAPAAKTAAPKAAPMDDRSDAKQKEYLRALSLRRVQIEQGRDLATLTIVAVPELQPPPSPVAPNDLPATTPASPAVNKPASPEPVAGSTLPLATTPPDAAPAESPLKDRSRPTGETPDRGINPAFYWLPALAVIAAGFWWWRRSTSAHEPPPL